MKLVEEAENNGKIRKQAMEDRNSKDRVLKRCRNARGVKARRQRQPGESRSTSNKSV